MSASTPVTTGARLSAADVAREARSDEGFQVHLENFEGPFELLLALIGKHRLDITEVALSQVTDEFIAYLRSHGNSWDLSSATDFLVVAATLLDLKAARLLPTAEVDDEEDLALLEARDLLFARLLQYRAYKQVAAHLAELEGRQSRRFARTSALEPRFAEALPDVLIGIDVDRFAALAAAALTPRTPPSVDVRHLHVPQISIREHAGVLVSRLAHSGAATFRSLVSDCGSTIEVIARFLALLELYREGMVAFEQVVPLGELHVRWTGGERDDVDVTDEYSGGPGE